MKTLVKMYAMIEDDYRDDYREEEKAFYFPLSVVLEYLEGDDLTEFIQGLSGVRVRRDDHTSHKRPIYTRR